MPKLLEVIVTSAGEAAEAELGGADRLELVRSLEEGGLTPPLEIVRQVLQAVSIPVRIMLRENASMSIAGPAELETLKTRARELANYPVGGFVLGFVKGGRIDLNATREILAQAPDCRATFHRACEHVDDSLRAIAELKQIPQIDRILTSSAGESWPEAKERLLFWQGAAMPEIRILVGIGLSTSALEGIAQETALTELHVGRAARSPQIFSGAINRARIASLKSALR